MDLTRDCIDEALRDQAIVTRKCLVDAGATRGMIEAAVASGRLVRLRLGFYCSNEAAAHALLDEALVCASTGGVIWGASAGRFHQLTDDIPHEIGVLVPHGVRSHFTDAGAQVAIRRSRDRRNLEVGVEDIIVDGLHIRITDRTRTVVDLVRMGDVRQHAVEAVRTYLAEGGNAADLHRMAEAFDALDQVVPLTEAIQVAFDRGPSL